MRKVISIAETAEYSAVCRGQPPGTDEAGCRKGGGGMARKNQLTEFGITVRQELDRRGMTQRELAEECGINFRVVHDIMVGLNRKEATIRLISERLGIPS